MKSLAAFLALVTLALVTVDLHADTVNLTLATGVSTDNLVETSIANGEQFTYTNETLGLLANGNLLNSSTSVFTATYVDALGTLGVLNFTDLCTKVTILGPAVPCQQFAFSFTDVTLGDASVIAALGAAIDVDAGIATLGGSGLSPDGFNLLGASLALGSGQIDFSAPPSGGGGSDPSPVPEPGTLGLFATGLLGAAGIVRRRFAAVKI
jgi:hypothetical protein